MLEVDGVQGHGEWKKQPLLGSGTINGDATMEHITLCNITNLSTTGNGVFYAVSVNSYIMQRWRNCGKQCSLWVCAETISEELKHRKIPMWRQC